MYRLKAVEKVSETEELLVWSGILQVYDDGRETWADQDTDVPAVVSMGWYKIGRTASRIPITLANVNSSVRLNASTIVFLMPDYITISDLTDVDQLQFAPGIIAAVINSSGAEIQAQKYDYDDRAEVVTDGLTGAYKFCCLDRQRYSFVRSQIIGDKLTIHGTFGVYGWVRGGYAVGMPPAVQYVDDTTVVTIKHLDPLVNRILVGSVVKKTVTLATETREIGLSAEFPFVAADSEGRTVPRRIIVSGGVTRLDVTMLSGEVQVMVPKWVDDLYTYFGSPSLVIGPDPTDPVSVAEGVTHIPPGTTEAFCVYGRDGNEWVLPDLLAGSTAIYKLWMALGTNVGANGMISEGLVENPDWDFSDDDIGHPIYLGEDGTWSTTAPNVDDNAGEAFRMIGWIESPTTIDFSGRIPGGMLANYS